ncbi:M20/M25/M40 family metallo-hydrolase [Maribellus sediminis]|uniref:M20/M25/M40 family metallo-hydrolase n=1 Tax=Maribellus sediminis TaxID=2696285 RepID=UPI00142F773F|nr:M20/M25/M40 family metallo-hydrolase [Maribellus sediminis]
MKHKIFLVVLLFAQLGTFAQDDASTLKSIFDEALTDRTAYENLRVLCKEHKGRITGSPEAENAVEYTYELMNKMNLDAVDKQPVQVPQWVRGEDEQAYITSSKFGKTEVPVTALGMTIGTGNNGLQARIIEFNNFDEMENAGEAQIKGKIVFFNYPMKITSINTFLAYGEASSYRTTGAARAAKYGAVGVVVRSITTALDDYPHTGVMRYNPEVEKIPAVAISTNGAELLHKQLAEDPELKFYFRTTCKTLPDVESNNVIGEIRGSEFPEEIITVGGHLDAWENGEGAHDDGAGCMQSIEVLRLYKQLGIQPKRTIRAVMFMDEEVAQCGGKEYARQAAMKGEKHYFALESDRGALVPRGFGVSGPEERVEKILALKKYFELYGITDFIKGGGGVDISPLREFGTPLSSYIPDDQRYFDFHHSGFDTFEQVNFREFQMGSAAIASFIYLIDKYDL